MSMAQAWSLIGLLATAFGALIVTTHRSMSLNVKQLSETLSYGLSGLRNEMVARFEKVDERFERIDERFERVDKRFDRIEDRLSKVESTTGELDHDVRALNRAVLGGSQSPPAR